MKSSLKFCCFVGLVLFLWFLVTTGHPAIAIVVAILAFCIAIGPVDRGCECCGTAGCF